MVHNDFDTDHRYCPSCRRYVRYLLSPQRGYCTRCAGPVQLFSPTDEVEFHRDLRIVGRSERDSQDRVRPSL